MPINTNAPAIAQGEIIIPAGIQAVWKIMADINRWPSWNPEIKTAELRGPLAPGSVFAWKSGPGTITSVLRRVDPPYVLEWTGKTMGISAVHTWTLAEQNGNTLVRTEESWDGFLVRLFRAPMQKTLQKAIDTGLQYLRAAMQ